MIPTGPRETKFWGVGSTKQVGSPENKDPWASAFIGGVKVGYPKKSERRHHWYGHYVHFMGVFEGHGQERAGKGTCNRSQPYHTDTPGHLRSPGPGAHSLFEDVEAAEKKGGSFMEISNLQ